jgi:hypothetical protein
MRQRCKRCCHLLHLLLLQHNNGTKRNQHRSLPGSSTWNSNAWNHTQTHAVHLLSIAVAGGVWCPAQSAPQRAQQQHLQRMERDTLCLETNECVQFLTAHNYWTPVQPAPQPARQQHLEQQCMETTN